MKMLAEDIAAFVNVLGVDDPDLVWTLATMPWKSVQERDMFIAEIGTMNGPVEA
jgi:hypothetical protein